MVPGEEWYFNWGFGTKSTINSTGKVVKIKIPELTDIDTMKGDFVTFKGGSHLTTSMLVASAALVSMTLY